MKPTSETVLISRVIVPLMAVVVWTFFYLDARLAYRMPRGLKKYGYQLATVAGAAVVVFLQIQVMMRLTPSDAYGNYFAGFVFIECGGALVVLFTTLFRERARSRK